MVYIDESGHPRPSDPTTRPVILAVCVHERDAGRLIRRLFSLKRGFLEGLHLSKGEQEGKAVHFLNRRALLHSDEKRAYADALFDFIGEADLAIFAIVMERPPRLPYDGQDYLQPQFRWLLERVERFMENDHPKEFAIPIFDGQDPASNQKFADCFTGFMTKSAAGRGMQHIVPNPLFVDSYLTPGIQIADVCAYVLRICYERNLFADLSVFEPYLAKIKRFGTTIRGKTIDYPKDDGGSWRGITTMDAGRFQYDRPVVAGDATDELESLAGTSVR